MMAIMIVAACANPVPDGYHSINPIGTIECPCDGVDDFYCCGPSTGEDNCCPHTGSDGDIFE